jgi:hypothetical protein
MARRGDTEPLCQVAQASVTFIGVSLLPLSGDKSLVLCPHGSQGTPLACSSRRRRGSPLEVITIYGILGVLCKEALRLAHVQCTDVPDRPTECVEVSSRTRDAFPQLSPPFEAACPAPMAMGRLAGKPRTARPFAV